MTDKEKAASAKALGNKEFTAKNYKEAITHFTEAIGHDPTDHVFFSNRSACHASLENFEAALKDGAECVKLKPDWAKGYTRKGLAEYWLKKYDDAADTYKAGLKLSPDDASMKEGLQKCMDAKYDLPGSGAGAGAGGPGGGGGLFGMMDPSALASAATKNPKIKEYMKDAALMQTVNSIMQLGATNPQLQQQMVMQMMQKDPRVLEIIMAMQGLDVSTAEGADFGEPGEAPKPAPKKKEEPPPPPEDLRTPEQKEADEYKTKGNELYKAKKFEEALVQYDKAIEKCPNDLLYVNNKNAVYIEMGEAHWDKVLTDCQDLLDRRYDINSANPGGASFEKVAKVYVRMASIYEKKKDFTQAKAMYEKSLMEDNTRYSRNALRELERAQEKHEKEAYLDPAKAEEHRLKGNDFFKGQEYAAAKAEYDEGIKRNPKDAKLYSNRAASLTKLAAYPDALKDLDECLVLDPTFVKAYSRKGAAHFYLKEYNKALAAYAAGLKVDPTNAECLQGQETVVNKIQETNKGEVDEEQIRHSMADPEIQNILKDPQINMFLKELQENPKEAQKAMNKDPKIADAVSKLMAAGILRTG
jgi:stress-induced-phosphoprotein 1